MVFYKVQIMYLDSSYIMYYSYISKVFDKLQVNQMQLNMLQ